MSEQLRELVFATGNQNKVEEIQMMCPPELKLLCLKDLGFTDELEETGKTLEDNAVQKAKFISEKFELPCFSEDTGLEIEALHDEPGIYSARYAGPDKNDQDNIDLVLKKMSGIENRSARFRTVIALTLKKKIILFEGVTSGVILRHKAGMHGFGYDPIFKPDGNEGTFGEMTKSEKNKYSHRRKAFKKMADYLKYI